MLKVRREIIESLKGHMLELAGSLEFLVKQDEDPVLWDNTWLDFLEEAFRKIRLAHARFCEGELELAKEILKEIEW